MKYVNLSAFPVTWTKIGTTGFTTNQNTNPAWACVVNGYMGFFYATAFNEGGGVFETNGAVLYLFDGQGGMCTYQTANFNPKANPNALADGQNIFQNGNTFIYALSNGGTWQVVIPPIFQAGATYVLPPTQLAINSPCGSGSLHSISYCSQQGLIGYEFLQPFGGSNDAYWASIYDTLGNFKGGGYLGNDTFDLFNQVSNVIPLGGKLFFKNGYNVAQNFGNTGPNQQAISFLQPFLNGDYTKLVCGGSGNRSVFVSGINQSTLYPVRDFNCPYISDDASRMAMGMTDANGYFIYPDNSQGRMLSNDWFIDLPTMPGGSSMGVGYLLKQKKIYNLIPNNGGYSGDVYVASLDLTPYGPQPISTRSDFSGLANYHRAVSPNGTFQA